MQLPFTFTKDPALNEFDPLALENEGPAWFEKAHADDAAFDLRSTEDWAVAGGDWTFIKTGLRVAIPEGYAGLVLSRSGMAKNDGLTVLNSPGLIDPGYRGEIGVTLMNHGWEFKQGKAGDRIAQLLFVKTADLAPVFWPPKTFDRLGSTRGEDGFGSTGR